MLHTKHRKHSVYELCDDYLICTSTSILEKGISAFLILDSIVKK